MSEQLNSSEILAHWHYAPDEWREFVEYEKHIRGDEIGGFFQKIIPYIAAIIIVMMIAALISGVLAAIVFVFLLAAGFLTLVVGIHWLIRQNELSTLKSRAGEVRITIYGINTNGLLFDWEFEGDHSRFQSVRRLNAHTATGKLNFLEFKCLVKIKVRGTYQTFDKHCRVPIPNGKEAEADILIQRIYQAQAAFSRSDGLSSVVSLNLSAPDFSDEHDFRGSTVCHNCGGSIEAETHFRWKCKK